jgi:hypothetical protein
MHDEFDVAAPHAMNAFHPETDPLTDIWRKAVNVSDVCSLLKASSALVLDVQYFNSLAGSPVNQYVILFTRPPS